MDYINIITKGESIKDKKQLSKYYQEQYLKYPKAIDFFADLLEVIENLEEDIDTQINQRKDELHDLITEAETGSIPFKTEKEFNTFIKKCTDELNHSKKKKYSVKLGNYLPKDSMFQNNWIAIVPFKYYQIQFHKKAIIKAQRYKPQLKENKLSLKQIALIYSYNEKNITRKNAVTIAEKYGHKSGDRLYQNYNKYYNSIGRKGDEGTRQKNKNKIKDIEHIIEFLTEDKKQRALDELKILNNIQKTEY